MRTLGILLLITLTAFPSFGAMTMVSPSLSPMLNEYDNAKLTDEGSRKIPMLGILLPDSNGATGLDSSFFVAGQVSQVTGRTGLPQYKIASGKKLPVMALVGINQSTHLPVPLTIPATAITGTDAHVQRVCQITSAAAGTAVHCLTDADVGAGRSAYLSRWTMKVNGGTVWATTATCSIQDTNGSPVNFVTVPVADLTANAFVGDWSSSVVTGSAYTLGTGSTAGKGLDIKCDANGTGSTIVLVLTAYLK